MESYMFSEIKEQPKVAEKIISNYTSNDDILLDLPQNIKKVKIIASGSSFNAATIASHFFKENLSYDIDCDYSSEFVLKNYRTDDKDALYIFISQSGETSDTVKAQKKAKQKGIKTVAITNKEGSTLWNDADVKINLFAGEEKSIAATKTFTAQVLSLYLIVLKYIKFNNSSAFAEKMKELKNLPSTMQEFIDKKDSIAPVAKKLSGFNTIAVLGSRIFYAVGFETSLKTKETSYLNVNPYPIGEFLHGYVAIMNNKGALLVFVDEENKEANLKVLNTILDDYKPTIVTVSEDVDDDKFDINYHIAKRPLLNKVFDLMLFSQLMALGIAGELGNNVDSPKGLKKVVLEKK